VADDLRRALRGDRLAQAGLVVVVVLSLAALLAPALAPYDPAFQGDLRTERYLPPSLEHPMGTDQAARDVFSRVLHGARVSLGIGFLATGLAVTLGTAVGAVAGYLGGWIDAALMRTVDVILAMPRLVLLVQPHAVMHAEPRVHPLQHPLGHLRLEQLALDEELQHASAKRLRQHRRRVRRQPHEGPVGPETTICHEGVDVRLPIEERAVRLDGERDAD